MAEHSSSSSTQTLLDTSINIIPLGATLQSFNINGFNIVQGFDTQDQYAKHNSPYFGATIGRIANRISGAKINSLNGGKSYSLPDNNNGNTLHGGTSGWDKRFWDGPKPIGTRSIPGIDNLQGGESVQYTMHSPHDDQGFPGSLHVKTTYTAGTQHDRDKKITVLSIEYEASFSDDTCNENVQETIINMTNHSYFNLSGAPTTEGTTITLPTSSHLPINSLCIPTRAAPTPFDFDTTLPFTLTPQGPDIDHCFILRDTCPIDTRGEDLRLNLSARHDATGRCLEVWSTEPAFQVYTGHGLNVPAVGSLPARGARAGFCCEPGRWVDAGNVEEWRGQVLLKKGERYGCRIVYRAWTE